MKILLDENLSHYLPGVLADLFAGIIHVRSIGMAQTPDTRIWDYAEQNGYIIVTKDAWFYQRSLILGAPPKVVWLSRNKSSAQYVEDLLRRNAIRIKAFFDDPESSYLVLD